MERFWCNAGNHHSSIILTFKCGCLRRLLLLWKLLHQSKKNCVYWTFLGPVVISLAGYLGVWRKSDAWASFQPIVKTVAQGNLLLEQGKEVVLWLGRHLCLDINWSLDKLDPSLAVWLSAVSSGAGPTTYSHIWRWIIIDTVVVGIGEVPDHSLFVIFGVVLVWLQTCLCALVHGVIGFWKGPATLFILISDLRYSWTTSGCWSAPNKFSTCRLLSCL